MLLPAAGLQHPEIFLHAPALQVVADDFGRVRRRKRSLQTVRRFRRALVRAIRSAISTSTQSAADPSASVAKSFRPLPSKLLLCRARTGSSTPPWRHCALDAVHRVHRPVKAGEREIVDGELLNYYGEIPYAGPLQSVARRVSDGQLLGWIKRWLEMAAVEDD